VAVAGDVRVNSVKFRVSPTIGSVGIGYYMAGNCGIEVAGGFHFSAIVDLESAPGTAPQYFGVLKIAQNVIYSRKRTLVPPIPQHQFECARNGQWSLDGQYPYNNQTLICVAGTNPPVNFADDPGVLLEVPPHETVTVDDHFRTWLIWEATDNSLPVAASNPAKQHILLRVDWSWKGEATQIGAGTPGALCTSTQIPADAWGLSNQASGVDNTLIGSAATAPQPGASAPTMPVFSPVATPNAWVPC